MDATRQAVLLRANGHCERCGRSVANIPASVHHRRPRGMGGTSDDAVHSATNCVLLCGSGTTGCHGYIESNRAEAAEHGWLVLRRDPRHPADVPVFAGGGWWFVTAEHFVPMGQEVMF